MRIRHFNLERNAKGIILPTTMIILLCIMIIAGVMLRATKLDEKISGGKLDKDRAFLAAETALSIGEEWIKSNEAPFYPLDLSKFNTPSPTYPGLYNSNSQISIDLAITNNNYFTLNNNTGFTKGHSINIPNLDRQPIYFIKLEGYSCYPPEPKAIFEVTSRGWGYSSTTEVTLVSKVKLPLSCGAPDTGSDLSPLI